MGQNRLIAGVSKYNVFNDNGHNTAGHLEARLGAIPVWKMHPWVGIEWAQEGMFAAFAGLEGDIDLSEHWVLNLQAGAGYLDDGDENFNADNYPTTGLNFRSQAEIAYQFDGGTRLGLAASHTSNAGTHMPNPGGNQLTLNVGVPFKTLQFWD